jgi:hypothetical protein
MASELRFALKCNANQQQGKHQQHQHPGRQAPPRTTTHDSPNNDITDRFHPLGPPYGQYEFETHHKGHHMMP